MRRLACGLVTLLAGQALAGQAVYHVRSDQEPLATAANGYVQQVRSLGGGEYEVRVATLAAPIGSVGSWAEVRDSASSTVPRGFELPPSLARELTPDLGAWEAATAVIRWSAERLAVDEDDTEPQDAVSVLRRGRGRCSGLANATVALLLAAGFEARTVSGALVGETAVVPHRWFECRLPGAGWVPSDPTLGLWIVTPRHLVFADTLRSPPRVRTLVPADDELGRLVTVGGRLLRPNRGGSLVCRLAGEPTEPPTVAVLRGAGGDLRRALLSPEAHFVDLLPGRWSLEIQRGARVVERRELSLRAGDFLSITVAPAEPEPAEGDGH